MAIAYWLIKIKGIKKNLKLDPRPEGANGPKENLKLETKKLLPITSI
jgi:hypothetical protein